MEILEEDEPIPTTRLAQTKGKEKMLRHREVEGTEVGVSEGDECSEVSEGVREERFARPEVFAVPEGENLGEHMSRIRAVRAQRTALIIRFWILREEGRISLDALVDTGATFMCVTEEIAMQLGFDITEVSQQVVTLADGHQRKVPKIAPVEIAFENRSYVTEAVVIGNEPLLGVIPLEAMDLVVDPRRQVLIVNPQHPNYPVALVK